MSVNYSYLALGDSYTIGEGVPLFQSYPYQTVQLLRKAGKNFLAPEIIAKTGWTTSELAYQLGQTTLNPSYDFVSLLIGVNNQYRGYTSSHYATGFEELLKKSLLSVNEIAAHVFVLSIPNWSLTPFANGSDIERISGEITDFNRVSRSISDKYKVTYVDITSGSPETTEDLTYLSEDGLHPSGKAYERWASLLSETILKLT